jgi:hypothetical protein
MEDDELESDEGVLKEQLVLVILGAEEQEELLSWGGLVDPLQGEVENGVVVVEDGEVTASWKR